MTDELAEFARCIREGATPETGLPEAIEVAAVLDAIGRSVEMGSAVDVAGSDEAGSSREARRRRQR